MAIEWWLALVAACLALTAAVAGVGRLLRGSERWRYVVVGARLTAALALVGALAAGGLGRGWWAFDLRLVAWGLALTVVAVEVFLAWRSGVDGGGPVADLAVMGSILAGWSVGTMGGCAQRTAFFWVAWVLLLLGVAGLVVGMGAGLLLGLRSASTRWGWKLHLPPGGELAAFLNRATALALVMVGGGLVVVTWWTWRLAGSLALGEPQYAWLAAAWLMAATSLLAWQLDRHPRRWAAILLAVAAGVAILGLLLGSPLNLWLSGL